MSREILEDLVNFKNKKREFAARFGVTQYTVQRAFDSIIEYATANSNIINTQDVVNAAIDEDSLLHDLFDWTQDNEYRLAQAELYLCYIGQLVSSDGNIYSIALQS